MILTIRLLWLRRFFQLYNFMMWFFAPLGRPTFLYRQESRQRNSSPSLAKHSILIGLLSETLWFVIHDSSQRLGVLPRPFGFHLRLAKRLSQQVRWDYSTELAWMLFDKSVSLFWLQAKPPPCAGVWVLMFLKNNIKSEAGMPSPVLLSMDANQNRTGQKTVKLTGYTSSGGRFSLGTFFVRSKKVPRFQWKRKPHTLVATRK